MIHIILKGKMIQITIDRKTPSVNHLYGHNRRGHFYLKKEGRDLREYIISKVRGYVLRNSDKIKKLRDVQLSLTVQIFENWFTKKGTIRKKDVANREKFLIDSVFKGLGLDDSYIFEHTMFKVQSMEEKAVIVIAINE
jgi:Holliday junction resolvase RusA-like endonuclease